MYAFHSKENIRHHLPKSNRHSTPENPQKKTKSASQFLKPDYLNIFQRKEDNASARENRITKNNTGLPDHLKTGIESLSGISMDAVKVHYNSYKPATLQAFAYTQGTEIHVAPGQEKHLPHEAWHVVQQMQGRVNPTMQMNGVKINDNSSLEHEADVMGRRAMQLKRPTTYYPLPVNYFKGE